MGGLFVRLFTFFQQRRLLLALFLLAGMLLSGWGVSRLKVDKDIMRAIPANPEITRVKEVIESINFSKKLVVHLTLEESTQKEALVAAADSLFAGLERSSDNKFLSSKVGGKFDESKVGEIYDFLYSNLPLFLEEADYAELERKLDSAAVAESVERGYKTLISPMGIALRKQILQDPLSFTPMALKKFERLNFDKNLQLANGYLQTKGRKHLLVFFMPALEEKGAEKKALYLLQDKIADLNKSFEGKVFTQIYGGPAVAEANEVQIKKDVWLTVSLSLMGMLALIWFFFPRKRVFPLLLLPVVLGASFSMGLISLFKGEVSAIALGVGSIVLGITIDFSFHVVTHAMSGNGPKKLLREISDPLLMSSLTTASAFFCLFLLHSEVLQEMGLFAGGAVLFASIMALLVLPHFLPKMEKGKGGSQKIWPEKLLDRYLVFVSKHRPVFLVIVLIASGVLGYYSTKVSFESDMMRLNFLSEELERSKTDLEAVSTASMKSVYLISKGETVDAALENGRQAIPDLEKLREAGAVKEFVSLGALLPDVKEQEKRLVRWNAFWTAERVQRLEENLEAAGKPLGFRAGTFGKFTALVKQDFTPMLADKMLQRFGSMVSELAIQNKDQVYAVTVAKIDRERRDELYEVFSNREGIVLFDQQYVTNNLVELVKKEFDTLALVTLSLVFVIMLVAYGRIELATITFLPILLGWVFTLGMMGLLGISFNLINIIISTFIFGLGVDYSIFVMNGLLLEYKTGEKHLGSHKLSIILSSLTTFLGVGVLVFAEHPALKSIALVSIIGLASALFLTFTLVPILFQALVYKNGKRRTVPVTFYSLLITIHAYGLFLAGCVLLTSLAIPVFYLLPLKKEKREAIFHYLIWLCCRLIILLGLGVQLDKRMPDPKVFEKPSVIIANHQSFIDILLLLSLSPKLIMVTKDWVWNSPVFGRIVRMAGFFPASAGSEKGVEQFEKMIEKGYSIVIFPEGTRSNNGKVKRFHKGAFLAAEQLKLDIVPVILHGTGDRIPKGELLIRKGTMVMAIQDRISHADASWGNSYSERTKSISKHFKKEYQALRNELETVDYFRDQLLASYVYKGPVLEWYARVKVALEKNYAPFDKLLPKQGKILDLGCGYGFLAQMLEMRSEERNVFGMDYDVEKITVAQYAREKENVSFSAGNALEFTGNDYDAIVMSDLLHYLPKESQQALLQRSVEALSENGMLVLRDGDSDLSERKQQGTKLTEFFSIKLLGFNKADQEPELVSGKKLEQFAKENNMSFERLTEQAFTANVIFVLRKN